MTRQPLHRWLTYAKLLAIALVSVIGFVYLARQGPVAHANFSGTFRNSCVHCYQCGMRTESSCSIELWAVWPRSDSWVVVIRRLVYC